MMQGVERLAGPEKDRNRTRELIVVAVVLGLASVLLLANLGDQYLWQDEAQTALIAGTILHHGIPLGHDGKNSFSQDGGQDYGKNYIWLWHPWLSFYVLAGFFAAFGKSTLVARLPFALFGVATVVLAYVYGASLWKSRRAGVFAAATLAINVSFLILARQCRYYAPGMFFALLALYGYSNLVERRKYAWVTFTISAVLLFHTQYVHYAALIAAVVLHAVIYHRDRIKPVLLAVGVTVLANTPWIIWFSAMGKIVGSYTDIGVRVAAFGVIYLLQIGRYIFPPLLLVAPLAVWAVNRWGLKGQKSLDTDLRRRLALLLLYVVMNLAAILFTATYPFFRFLAPTIPVACLIIALILNSIARLHKVAGTAAALVILVALGYAWRMPDYYYEITHRYIGPVDGIVGYLKKHAHKNDVVAMTYDDLPVKFYTGLRVVGGLTGEDLTPAKTADWVIIRRHLVSDSDIVVRDFLMKRVPRDRYETIRIDYPDLAFQNREEPDQHLFRTTKDVRVVILHKRPEAKQPDAGLVKVRPK
jgi:4-amino-4-deoxy-L-arabinose transferase-like glycosyltransferase